MNRDRLALKDPTLPKAHHGQEDQHAQVPPEAQ
jgi:hypothetical protein